jgi:hypothetical protein
VSATEAASPESLGSQLADALTLAEAGQFDAALRFLMAHDQAVRAGFGSAAAAEVPRWRVLLEAQRRSIDRLLALRDAAGREVSRVGRARRVAAAYESAP